MSQAIDIQQQRSNRQSFAITSGVIACLLALLLFIKLQHPVIEDAISGVMIDFGDHTEGLGDDNEREAGGQDATPQKTVRATPTPVPPTHEPRPVKTASSPVKTPPTKTIVAEDANAVAIAKMKKEEEQKRQQELLEQQRIAEAVRKAEEARKAREAEEKRIREQTASVFSKGKNGSGSGSGNASGNGPGNGQGNSTAGGNQGAQWGQPGGDPNGTGTGTRGSGPGSGDGTSYDLRGRTWRQRPLVFDNSQKTGKVVVAIRVDKAGNVIYAKYQQKGSTTTDAQLIRLAEQGALKAKFNADPTADEEQFGSITFKFSVQ
jgi:outer membrane biosynthesis protein TonB